MMLCVLCVLCFFIQGKALHAHPPRPEIAESFFWYGIKLAGLLAATLVPLIWFAIKAEQDV